VKDATATAPIDAEFITADSISESANTAKTTQISLGDNPTAAKKLYLRYYAVSDGSLVGGTAVMDVPALENTSFEAEINPSELSLGTVLEGYSSSDASATSTISNTGAGTISFSVDTTADGYTDFSKYFDVDTSGAVNIASGGKGSITVTPKEDLTAGDYSGTFYLVDQIDNDNSLKLGPVTVSLKVAAKGDSTVDGVRTPEGEYTPSVEFTSFGFDSTDTSTIYIDNEVAYCANYNYILYSNNDSTLNSYYKNKYSVIRDVTNKELDAYTGLPSDGSLYPPNNNGFTPVKEGSEDSTVRENVARVLYYGYPNDALHLRADGNSKYNLDDVNNYVYCLELKTRCDFAFEIATQCAIWHYTDGIDFSKIFDDPDDSQVQHVRDIYQTVPSWGWRDVQNLYNFLVGNNAELKHTTGEVGGGRLGTRGYFRNGVEYPLSTSAEVPEDFAVDLFVVDNPVNTYNGDSWTQNLVTASTTSENTSTTDISVTKIWDDQSNANGSRPDADTFKNWIYLYNGTTDVTDTYTDSLTVTDNGNNTYTVNYSGLPVSGYSYSIKEVIPEEYADYYKIPDDANSASSGGSIKNYAPTEETHNASLTIKKTDSDGNVLEGAKFTLYTDAACTIAISGENAIDASSGTVTISTAASYLRSYLPTENNGTKTVYLKETTAPEGYEVSDTVYEITLGTVIEKGWDSDYTEYTVTTSHTIAYNNNVTLTVVDKEKASTKEAYDKLTITKVSDTGDTLEGAVFTLYREENSDESALTTLTSGSDGTIVIDTAELPDGLENPTSGTNTYYMKETSAPDGYTGNSKIYEIVLGISTETTGSVTTTTHTITCGGSNSLRIVNTNSNSTERNDELTINKTDADTGIALPGAEFALYTDANDDTTKINGSNITTDSSGQAYINTAAGYLSGYLPTEDGSTTLYLKETSAPTGYTASNTSYKIKITRSSDGNVVTYSISSDAESYSSDTGTLSVSNTPVTSIATDYSELTVYKVDNTQQPLEGAKFTLYSDAGCTNVITKLATDSDGTVTISTADLTDYLPATGSTRKVYLKETSAPDGYKLNDTVYMLTLGSKAKTAWNTDHTSKVTTTTYTITNASDSSDAVTVVDQPVVNLTVNKSWSSDLSNITRPVTVRLTQNGTETDPVQELTLNEGNSWTDTFEDLPKYDDYGNEITYGVIEVDGSKSYNVTYTQNSSGSITVTNSAKSIHTTVTVDGNASNPNQALTVDYSQLGDDHTANVVDTVSYTGLDTSTTYTLVGRLKDVTDEDNTVIIDQASAEFTPTAADGEVDVDFGNVTLEVGHKYVVYEYLYTGTLPDRSTDDENHDLPDDKTPTAEHHDNDDKAQTFTTTLEIHTTVEVDGNKSSSDQELTVDYSQLSDGVARVADTVSYTNLDTSKTYTVVGRLMDVTDEDNAVIIDQASAELTPTAADGSVAVDFGEVALEAGHKYVVYEYLYAGELPDQTENNENHDLPDETPISEHHDNEDKAQTFVIIEIHTTVEVDGNKSSSDQALSVDYSQLDDDHTVNVVDTVSYTGLDTSKTYTVVGRLMDVTDEDNAVIIDQASAKLTPTAADGSVAVDFGEVALEAGHKYVVYEYLYTGEIPEQPTNDENHELPKDETPTAEHHDNDDKAQTFTTTDNDNTPEDTTTSLSVKKEWADGASGESAEVELYANGTATGTKAVLSEDNSWSYTFSGLDKNDTDGKAITYTVVENTNSYKVTYSKDADGTIVVTNSPKTDTVQINIPVTKVWADGAAGESAEVELYSNDQATGNKIVLNEGNQWSGSFNDLPKYDSDGNAISYRVVENTNTYDVTYSVNSDGTIVVTNRPKTGTEKVDIPVNKVWADGASGESATVVLTANGTETEQSAVLNEGNGWNYTFSGLDKYDADGNEISYSVVEKTNSYRVTIVRNADGSITVTNRPSSTTRSIPVEKTWSGGTTPTAVTMVLMRDGVQIDSIELNASNGWKGSFTGLEQYAADGHEYSYTVVESGRWMYARAAYLDNTVTINNFHLPTTPGSAVIDIPVYKKWAAGTKAEKVTVVLLQDGNVISGEQELSADNNWTATFCNLPVDDGNGHTYTYSVEETGGKWQYIVTKNADGSITITNMASTSVNTGVQNSMMLYALMGLLAVGVFTALKAYQKKHAE
jgi:TQXA domain-containing protein